MKPLFNLNICRHWAIVCLLFLFPVTSGAAIFVVTTNSVTGSGSFSEALQMAAANGTAGVDIIRFNLPGTSMADRTIPVSGTLQLSSSLTIDGTSQPGSVFGISDTKIILEKTANAMCSGLSMANVSNIELYGLWFKNFTYLWNLSDDCHGYAIYMNNVSDIIIGNPGKGNAFSGSHPATIFHKSYFGIDYLNPVAFADDITINNNIFALKDDATDIDGWGYSGVDIGNGRNILIDSNRGRCGMSVGAAGEAYAGFVKFTNNDFANAIDPATPPAGSFGIAPRGVGTDLVHYDLEITGNKLATSNQYCIILWDMRGKILIDNNEIGAYFDTKDSAYDTYGIGMIRCNTNQATRITNNIIQNRKRGIWTTNCNTVLIENNSIYCNSKGIVIQSPLVNVPVVSVTNAISGNISGHTSPGAKVQLFSTDVCTTICENGKTLLGVVTADAAGMFNLPVVYSGLLTAIATLDSSSSEFNGIKIDTIWAQVKNATCGANNGSITGIRILNAASWRWENDLGQVISTTDTSLTGLAPGRYRLILNEPNVNCHVQTGFFEITAITRPIINGNPFSIVQPTCGMNNGSVSFTGTTPPGAIHKWTDEAGNMVAGNQNTITDLPPGKYYYTIFLLEDNTCFSTYGPFILTNQSGPMLNNSALQVVKSKCGGSNGSISGLTVTGATGFIFRQWINSLGNVVSSDPDLLNVPAGQYSFKFKDATSCDTLRSAWYTVEDTGSIRINMTGVSILPAGCTRNNGSIAGIQVEPASQYTWHDSNTGLVLGNTLLLGQLFQGNYQLTATNALGCSATSPLITVPLSSFAGIEVLDVSLTNATCGTNNGNIIINRFSADSLLYNFKWIHGTTGQLLGSGTAIHGLPAGSYILQATDSNGCEKNIDTAIIHSFAKPSFNYTSMLVNPDKCSTGNGSISGIIVNSTATPLIYHWINQSSDTVSLTSGLNNVSAGSYQLTVSDNFGCTAATLWIDVPPAAQPLSLPDYADQEILINTPAVLSVVNFMPATYIMYRDAAGVNEIARNQTGIFATGQLSTDTAFYIKRIWGTCESGLKRVYVKVIKHFGIYVPSAFTPNGDGRNDYLKPLVTGNIRSFEFAVYNRYGEMLFITRNPLMGWDGLVKGIKQETGNFIWICRYRLNNNPQKTEKGQTLLLR